MTRNLKSSVFSSAAIVLISVLACAAEEKQSDVESIGPLVATWVANSSYGAISSASSSSSISSILAVEFIWKAPEGGSQDGNGPTVIDAQFPIFYPHILIFKSYSVQHNKDWYWGFDIVKKSTVWNISVCNTIDSYPKCWAQVTPTDQFSVVWEVGRKVMQIDAATGQVYAQATVTDRSSFSAGKPTHGWAAANEEITESYYTPGIFFIRTQTPDSLDHHNYYFFNLIKYPTTSFPANLSKTACTFMNLPYKTRLLDVGGQFAIFAEEDDQVRIFNVSTPSCSISSPMNNVWGSLLSANTVRSVRGGWFMAHPYPSSSTSLGETNNNQNSSAFSLMNFSASVSNSSTTMFEWSNLFPYPDMNEFYTLNGAPAISYRPFDPIGIPMVSVSNCQSSSNSRPNGNNNNNCSFQALNSQYAEAFSVKTSDAIPGDDLVNYVIRHIAEEQQPNWVPLGHRHIFIPYFNSSSSSGEGGAPAMTFIIYEASSFTLSIKFHGNLSYFSHDDGRHPTPLRINMLKQVGKPVYTYGVEDVINVPLLLGEENEGINGPFGWSAIIMVQLQYISSKVKGK